MTIICHGTWSNYTPRKKHPSAPPATLYCRRDEDGVDWYNFLEQDVLKEESVKVVCLRHDDTWIAAGATRDATMLFPSKMLLIEVEGYKGEDLYEYFVGRLFDLDVNELREKV